MKDAAISPLRISGNCTPYEGLQVTGWPVSTLVRGRFVVRNGDLVGAKGFGEHVARSRRG